MKIESIYYFNYTKKIGFYESIRDFRNEEMEYISIALSTPEIRVNTTPERFKISSTVSHDIRELVISSIEELREISQLLAENSPQYIMFVFEDGTKHFFEYNEKFYSIFNLIKQQRPQNDEKSEFVSPYAIQKDTPINNFNYQQEQYNKNNLINDNSKKDNKYILSWVRPILLLFVLIAAVIGIASAISQPDPDADLTPVAEPISGAILYGVEYHNGSEITVTASSGASCVVKLKNIYGNDVLSFYVRAGDTVTVGVPERSLYAYFATGEKWYGNTFLFGEKTDYSKDDTVCNFGDYTYEYTLYPVNNGNFSETPIDADEF